MGEVLSINTSTADIRAAEPVKDVIEVLEKWLHLAKDGQVQGVAIALATSDGAYVTTWGGSAGTRQPLAAGIMSLNYRYGKGLVED